ncbi:uncharacterized protein TNCT_462201, partial [Trichonephila clavata]
FLQALEYPTTVGRLATALDRVLLVNQVRLGPEDVELINNPSTSSSHLPSDVISSLSSAASQNAVRSAPSSAATTNNHVEVVAEV